MQGHPKIIHSAFSKFELVWFTTRRKTCTLKSLFSELCVPHNHTVFTMNEINFMFHLSSLLIAGVLEEKAIREVLDDEYFSSITEEMNNTWKKDHDGKSVKESLDDYLVEYIGKPITQLFRYKSQLLHH